MDYTLKINAAGRLDGWQEIHSIVCGCSVREAQKFTDGKYQEWSGFVSVHMCGKNYSFMTSDWGTIEHARDAADLFSFDGQAAFQKKNEAGGWDILPATEGAFV